MRLTSWCQLTAVRTSWHWNESDCHWNFAPSSSQIQVHCRACQSTCIKRNNVYNEISQCKSNCMDFAAFSWQYMTCTMNSGWEILSRLPTWFFLPSFSCFRARFTSFPNLSSPSAHHHPRPHQPSENERAKNLGMPAAPADRIITGKCIQSRENSSLSISICGWRLHNKGGGGCNLLSTSLVDGQPLPSLPRKLYSSGSCFVWRRTMAAWDEIHHQETRCCCCCCTSMRDRYGRFSLHRWRLTVGGNVTAKSFRRYNRAELLLPALDIVRPRLATLPIEK